MVTLSDEVLAALVSRHLGRPVRLGDWAVRPVDFAPSAVSTAAVHRIGGTAHADDRQLRWSIFVKVLQSPRHSPVVHLLPPDFRQEFVDMFPWRVEADVLQSGLPHELPPGLRTPRVLRIDDLGDDRVAMWLEDVAVADVEWDLDRFGRAARLLGRLAGRRLGDAIAPELRAKAGTTLRVMAAGRLVRHAFPQLRDDDLWRHPLLDPALRADLLTLAERVPAMLDRLDGLPQAIGHGDACPQNLLVPADAPSTFVAIDFSWQYPQAVGFDLGQLLVGRAHSGELPVGELPRLREALIAAYRAGLREEGHEIDPAEIGYGCDASLVIRTGFTSIPFERLAGPVSAELEAGVALTRYVADIGLGLSG